jgi:serine/threonine protein kinase
MEIHLKCYIFVNPYLHGCFALLQANYMLTLDEKDIKIVDVGWSCYEPECKFFTMQETNQYMAPETILGMTLSMSADMWSVGLIIGQLLVRENMFIVGNTRQQIIAQNVQMIGLPPKHMLNPTIAVYVNNYFGKFACSSSGLYTNSVILDCNNVCFGPTISCKLYFVVNNGYIVSFIH